jgi:phosphinothricin acetyltransferase
MEDTKLAHPVIRAASARDLPRLTEIYNHYVATTAITFDLEAYAVDERREWFEQFNNTGRHRLLVAIVDDNLVGFAGSMRFRTKRAYDPTIEMTVYCAPEATGRGIGTALYQRLFDSLQGEDIHAAVAAITLPNTSSVALHERFGFKLIGVLHEVGRKFNRYWDVAWYEMALDA